MNFRLNSRITNGLKVQSLESVYFTIISMLTVLLVGNYLEPKYFGFYTALYVVVNILSEVSDAGFKSIIVREGSSDSRMQKLLLYLIFNSLIIFLMYEFFIIYLVDYSPEIELWYKQLFGVLVVLLTLNNYYTAVLRKKMRFSYVSSVRVLGLSIGFLITVILTVKYENITGLLIGTIVSESIKLLIYSSDWDWKKNNFKLDMTYEIKNASGIYLSHLLGYLGRNVDYLIVSIMLGSEDLGLYAISYKLMQAPVKQIGGVVNKVMFPIYGNMSNFKETKKTFLFLINTVALYATIAFTIFFTASEILVALFFPAEWDGLTDILSIMTVGGVFLLIHNFTEPLLKKHADQTLLVIRQVLYLLFTVVFVCGGSIFGLKWAVIGVVSSLILMATVSLFMALNILTVSKMYLLSAAAILILLSVSILLINTSILSVFQDANHLSTLIIILMIDVLFVSLLLSSIKKNNYLQLNDQFFIPFNKIQ